MRVIAQLFIGIYLSLYLGLVAWTFIDPVGANAWFNCRTRTDTKCICKCSLKEK